MSNPDIGSFSELANIKGSEVERPKPLPIGHYIAQITGPGKEVKAQKSGNIGIEFPAKAIAPLDDVDADLLAEAGGIGDGKSFKLTFWMSPDARYRFTNFAQALGLDIDKNILEIAEEMGAGGVQFQVEHRLEADTQGKTDEDGNPVMWSRFDNPAKLAA